MKSQVIGNLLWVKNEREDIKRTFASERENQNGNIEYSVSK